MKFSIYRFDPDKDEKPYMQDYDIALEPADRMLLDALIRIKTVDDSLSLRRSCREGVCGSDAMNINGRNGLACITPVKGLKEPVELRPLPGLPVIRDLIVDMTQFFKQYHSIKPYLINDDPPPETERLQSPEERAELDGLYECILCACCSTACPSFRYLDLPRRLFAKLLNRLQQMQYRFQTCLSFVFVLLHYHMPQVGIREIQQCFKLPDARFVERGVMLIHEALQHDIQFQQSAPTSPAGALAFFHCFRWFFWSSWS